MASKKLTGKIAAERILMMEAPRPPEGVIDGYKALGDASGIVSDVMDELGITGVVGASVLKPTIPGSVMVGPALTVRNIARDVQVHKAAQEGTNTQGETEAHNLARPGDVLVIEGVMGCSNMGGQSATIGRRQGEAGAIVDGTLRDPDQYRSMGWPVWCRGYTPITGKWRMQTVEVNGIVQICGIPVKPGDLACADEAGVAFVPRHRAAEVLDLCRTIDAADTRRKADIESGMPLAELIRKKYK